MMLMPFAKSTLCVCAVVFVQTSACLVTGIACGEWISRKKLQSESTSASVVILCSSWIFGLFKWMVGA